MSDPDELAVRAERDRQVDEPRGSNRRSAGGRAVAVERHYIDKLAAKLGAPDFGPADSPPLAPKYGPEANPDNVGLLLRANLRLDALLPIGREDLVELGGALSSGSTPFGAPV
jgi:hypothetical protein